ncbi:LexA family transcriptional regulator [Zymobacter palmae]|uniref:Predicted transcriptional regulator n=1 Tax=Zymobacter palmae TaxID=33074 RepID=A0A348HBI7_9GAMM|nr:LexA family transcriptional regulator [Zymobacter palmae]BBG28989.1 predicted transcriptional regulator [Zymobacter palmae]
MDSKKRAGEVIDRIKAVLNLRSDREMARHFGYGTTSITSKRQRGSVPYEECVLLAETQGIDLNWLVLGKGISPLEGRGTSPGIITLNGTQLPPDREYAAIDLYDIDAAAGNGRLLEHEQVESTVYFERALLEERGLCADTLIGARVSGDSMNDTLKDGDRVLVDRTQVKPDGVFLFRMDDELRIKRLQRAAGGALRILSDNSRYSAELVRPEELDKIEIIGRCEVVIGRII